MKNYLSKHILLTISIISFILLLIPIVIFLCYFGGKTVSNDLSVWASFGDFIGGTLNVILSLSSLVILGLLTHNIGKQSNEENKNINFLIRRMDSYDLLSKYLTEIENFHIKGRIDLDKVNSTNDTVLKDLHFNKLEDRVNVYFDLLALLQTFPYRFGHLFKYDFLSKEYKDLLSHATVVQELFITVIKIIDDGSKMDAEQFVTGYENLYDSFHSFLEALAKELK